HPPAAPTPRVRKSCTTAYPIDRLLVGDRARAPRGLTVCSNSLWHRVHVRECGPRRADAVSPGVQRLSALPTRVPQPQVCRLDPVLVPRRAAPTRGGARRCDYNPPNRGDGGCVAATVRRVARI